jgi:hypothetical protein
MENSNQTSFLKLEVIWKDDDIFELSVIASNDDFRGKASVYATSYSLSKFALNLQEYPNNNNALFYELGKKYEHAYFSMRYYPIGFNGIIGVEINLESNVGTEYRLEEKDKLKLEIIVEPSAIDIFQKHLYQLAKTESGIATLYGRQ